MTMLCAQVAAKLRDVHKSSQSLTSCVCVCDYVYVVCLCVRELCVCDDAVYNVCVTCVCVRKWRVMYQDNVVIGPDRIGGRDKAG